MLKEIELIGVESMKGYELLGAGKCYQYELKQMDSIRQKIRILEIEGSLRFGNVLFCEQFLKSKNAEPVKFSFVI
ncbi:MAG: hypothetical protein ACW98X_17825 [Promethearchaeota archaeon]|jgi:hypothetical protein